MNPLLLAVLLCRMDCVLQLSFCCKFIILYHIEVKEITETFLLLYFEIRDVSYRPPGTEINILSGVNISLKEKRYGFLVGIEYNKFNNF